MNYCTNCGNKVDSNAFICTKCGAKLKTDLTNSMSNVVDNGGFGWGILGFFVPIVGLILFLVWKDERPKTAKAAGKGALIYVIFYIILLVFVFTLAFIEGFNTSDNDYSYDEEYYNFE